MRIAAWALALASATALSAAPLPRFEPNPVACDTRVVMETSLGSVVIELFPEKAPVTVKNFLHYVDSGFYDNTIFHRVIADFMIQGGGFVQGLKEKSAGAPIKNESDNGLSNTRGTISMARMAAPDSATVQFFINTKDNPTLDHGKLRDKHGYCVFGTVVDGMDVIDQIRRVQTAGRGIHHDVPVEDVVIRSIRRAMK